MRRQINIKLTEANIAAVNNKGGPTFHPRARGLVRCNQLPQLGHLTKAQVRYVRIMCGRSRQEVHQESPPKQETVRQRPRPGISGKPSYAFW